MKRLRFTYRMDLCFKQPVTDHYFALRCIPKSDEIQKIKIEKRQIDPADCLNESVDGFGNLLYTGQCFEPHYRFGYEITGEAEVNGMRERREALHPVYKYASAYTKPGEALSAYLSNMTMSDGTLLESHLSDAASLQRFSLCAGKNKYLYDCGRSFCMRGRCMPGLCAYYDCIVQDERNSGALCQWIHDRRRLYTCLGRDLYRTGMVWA